jgi:hypothetical protein
MVGPEATMRDEGRGDPAVVPVTSIGGVRSCSISVALYTHCIDRTCKLFGGFPVESPASSTSVTFSRSKKANWRH